jgi:hypothetical protein
MYQYEVKANRKRGNEIDYNILISATNSLEHAKKAMEWAKKEGFTDIQLSDSANLEKPDFLKAIKI